MSRPYEITHAIFQRPTKKIDLRCSFRQDRTGMETENCFYVRGPVLNGSYIHIENISCSRTSVNKN